MTYYRIALQHRQSALWMWKTTILTSLAAVLQLLKIYRSLPQNRLRIFTASTKGQLDEMLCLENAGQFSGSSTAAQFLLERKLSVPGMTHHISEQVVTEGEGGEPAEQELTIVAHSSLCVSSSRVVGSFHNEGISLLERRRLELEDGWGGDHPTPYRFTLPSTTPQMLAWIRLRARVQEGELTP
jgi:hypothetical protein